MTKAAQYSNVSWLKMSPKKVIKSSQEVGYKCCLEERKSSWESMNEKENKSLERKINRSAKDDYRNHVEELVDDMEQENAVGNTTEVYRIAKKLASKRKTTLSTQPSKDKQGQKFHNKQ